MERELEIGQIWHWKYSEHSWITWCIIDIEIFNNLKLIKLLTLGSAFHYQDLDVPGTTHILNSKSNLIQNSVRLL